MYLDLFQGRPCIFQKDNAKLHTASITTAWLHRRRVQAPNCNPFTNRKHLSHHKIKNPARKAQNCWAAISLVKLCTVSNTYNSTFLISRSFPRYHYMLGNFFSQGQQGLSALMLFKFYVKPWLKRLSRRTLTFHMGGLGSNPSCDRKDVWCETCAESIMQIMLSCCGDL